MSRRKKPIPVNNWSAMFGDGTVILKRFLGSSNNFDDLGESHRDDWHLFILQEEGSISMQIDFERHEIMASSVIYIHPAQVHRLLAFENAAFCTWAINNESLKPEYLKLLEEITPAEVMHLDNETFSIISETASLGIRYSERKQEQLYKPLLKDNCNTLVALVASQYLNKAKSTDKSSRFEIINKSFKAKLEHEFAHVKSPGEYAKALNVSTSYLNECVRNVTGFSVSHHIQQRIVLEAKRLLYHSDKSVKEIASELGYDDYSYFTRLFTKIAGKTPVAFRNENLE